MKIFDNINTNEQIEGCTVHTYNDGDLIACSDADIPDAVIKEIAKAAIDLSMVYAYFEIGRLIVEEEHNGGQRAAYGKYVIPELSKYLTAHIGRGFSVTNLKQMRKFYQVYAQDQIGQTLSDQFSNLPAVSTGRKFPLS